MRVIMGTNWPSVMRRSMLPAIDAVIQRRSLPVTTLGVTVGGNQKPPPVTDPEPEKEPEPEPA